MQRPGVQMFEYCSLLPVVPRRRVYLVPDSLVLDAMQLVPDVWYMVPRVSAYRTRGLFSWTCDIISYLLVSSAQAAKMSVDGRHSSLSLDGQPSRTS